MVVRSVHKEKEFQWKSGGLVGDKLICAQEKRNHITGFSITFSKFP
jgi:hypothetical protein